MRYQIEAATTDSAILETYAVMSELRPDVPESQYLELVREMQAMYSYRLTVSKSSGHVVSVAGWRLCRSLGWGRYLYVDDLVTGSAYRSAGFGKAMFEWLVAAAKQHACDELRLDSAVYRHEAHRFYLRERMDIDCFNFRLPIPHAVESQPAARLR